MLVFIVGQAFKQTREDSVKVLYEVSVLATAEETSDLLSDDPRPSWDIRFP